MSELSVTITTHHDIRYHRQILEVISNDGRHIVDYVDDQAAQAADSAADLIYYIQRRAIKMLLFVGLDYY